MVKKFTLWNKCKQLLNNFVCFTLILEYPCPLLTLYDLVYVGMVGWQNLFSERSYLYFFKWATRELWNRCPNNFGLLIITRRRKESSNCRFISVGQVSTTFHNGTPVYQKSSYQGSVSADICLSDRLWRSKTPGMEQAPGGKT